MDALASPIRLAAPLLVALAIAVRPPSAAADECDWSFSAVAATGTSGSLALLAGETPAVASTLLQDGQVELRLSVLTGSGWTTEVVRGVVLGDEFCTVPVFSVAADADGAPAVAYLVACQSARADEEGVWLARRPGASWTHERVEATRTGLLASLPLAFDPEGRPSLAWKAGSDAAARFAVRGDTGWTIEPAAPGIATFPYELDLAHDALGRATLAIAASTSGLHYSVRTAPGAWTTEEARAAAAGEMSRPSLAFDALGRPAIGHTRTLRANRIPMPTAEVARFDGAQWAVDTLGPEGLSQGSPLALGPGGELLALTVDFTAPGALVQLHRRSGASGSAERLLHAFALPLDVDVAASGVVHVLVHDTGSQLLGHGSDRTRSDRDADGIPDVVEPGVGRDPDLRDNDVFADARLFVMQQYRDFLCREGDAGGVEGWTDAIDAGELTRAEAVDAFLAAREAAAFADPLTRSYLAFFLRPPDPDGYLYWVLELAAGRDPAEVAERFASSGEFLERYGALSNSEYVTLVYRNVLGREPDPEGHAYWTEELDSLDRTRGGVMLAFSESAESRAGSAAEVAVSRLYLALLRRAADPAGLDFWSSRLEAGDPRPDVIAALLASDEYHDRFLP